MSDTSTNDRAERVMGRRLSPEQEETGVLAFDCPVELGYVCPNCNAIDEHGGILEWSEYAGFLWCSACDIDIPSALCIPTDRTTWEGSQWESLIDQRDWFKFGLGDAIDIFLDTTERAQADRLHQALDRLSAAGLLAWTDDEDRKRIFNLAWENASE